MEYLEPASHPVWKKQLAAGVADAAFAGDVGRTLARIHAATAGQEALASKVNDDALFRAIRLEPYFEFTAARHPEAAAVLQGLVEQTLSRRLALVHGDVSPKNILVGPNGPVFLDAECAWYGDPAFDAAFCLNHLLLKSVWVRRAKAELLASFATFAEHYLAGVDWEERQALEVARRAAPAGAASGADRRKVAGRISRQRRATAILSAGSRLRRSRSRRERCRPLPTGGRMRSDSHCGGA